MTRRIRMALSTALHVALAGALLMGACTDDEPPPGDATADGATATETSDDGDAIEVIGLDYAYGNLPATVSVGTRLSLVNESDAEAHEIVALRLPDDEERAAGDLLALPPAESEALLAGIVPAMVLVALPGEAGVAIEGDGTFTEAGRYLVLCAVPTGADPEAYTAAATTSEGAAEVEGGPPHFTQGMFGEIVVE